MEMMQTCTLGDEWLYNTKSKQERAKEIDMPSDVSVCQATVN